MKILNDNFYEFVALNQRNMKTYETKNEIKDIVQQKFVPSILVIGNQNKILVIDNGYWYPRKMPIIYIGYW